MGCLRTTVGTQDIKQGNGKATDQLMGGSHWTGFKNAKKKISSWSQIHGTPSQKQLVEAQRALTDRSLDPFSYQLFSGTETCFCFFLADNGNPSRTMIRGDLHCSDDSTDIIKQSPTIAVATNGGDQAYAGSSFTVSPEPSALPLPSFIFPKKDGRASHIVEDLSAATKDLLSLLHLK